MNKDIIVFDLDGTLSDYTHRIHLITATPPKLDLFAQECDKDILNEPVAYLYRLLYRTYPMFICSARPEKVLGKTKTWLKNNYIDYKELRLRPEGDSTPDEVLKKQWLDEWKSRGLNIKMAFEDRDKVVKMWRDNGITCFQVADGNF